MRVRRGQPDPYLRIGQEEQAKRFGETIWALREVNLEVRQGEILAAHTELVYDLAITVAVR